MIGKKFVALVFMGVMLTAFVAYPQFFADAAKKIKPITKTLDGQTIKIGVIASSTANYQPTVDYFTKIIKPDINKYCQNLGYDVNFDFVIRDAQSSNAIHLEIVKQFKNSGIDLFIGGGWSSQAQAALPYVNAKGMVMFSYSSTYPNLAIAGDNLFRMCPSDSELAPALVETLWSYGIKSVDIIRRNDLWAEGIVNLFAPLWIAKGGYIIGEQRYNPEATDFSGYLFSADDHVLTAEENYPEGTGVVLLSFNEAAMILQQVAQFNLIGLNKAIWFGADGTADNQYIIDNAGQEAGHVKLFSLMAAMPNTSKYNNLATRYVAATNGQPFSSYSAYEYDIAWVLARAVLEAQSAQGTLVKPLIQQICYDMYGAGGWCRLNQYGDRAPPLPYDIWGYEWDGTNAHSHVYGYYDTDLHTVTWDTALLGYTPPGP